MMEKMDAFPDISGPKSNEEKEPWKTGHSWDKLPRTACFYGEKRVPQTGIEPVTTGLGNRCSIQLSYWGIEISANFDVLKYITLNSDPKNSIRCISVAVLQRS